ARPAARLCPSVACCSCYRRNRYSNRIGVSTNNEIGRSLRKRKCGQSPVNSKFLPFTGIPSTTTAVGPYFYLTPRPSTVVRRHYNRIALVGDGRTTVTKHAIQFPTQRDYPLVTINFFRLRLPLSSCIRVVYFSCGVIEIIWG